MFSQFVCRSLLPAHLVVIARVREVLAAGRHVRPEEPQRVWSLASPSHFSQIKVWKVSPGAISPSSGWVKNVYEGLRVVLPVISRGWTAVFLTSPCTQEGVGGGAKLSCIAPFSAAPQRGKSKSRNRSVSLCPRSPGEMRNLCVLYSPCLQTWHAASEVWLCFKEVCLIV